MRDYDGCLAWLVTAVREEFSPETGEHKATIGRQAAGGYVDQSGRPGGEPNGRAREVIMAEVTLNSDRIAERGTDTVRMTLGAQSRAEKRMLT